MSDPVPVFVNEFNKIVKDCAIFICITRDSELQKQACAKLRELLARVEAEKEFAAASGDEDYANLLLGCECIADALISEINMWLLLKEGQPDKAWDALMAAQSNLTSAVRALDGFARIDDNIRRLDAVERLIFPPQVFLSSGMIVKNQICSICEGEYEDCEHVKGRPYMGKFCIVSLIPSAVDHVSIVDNPADKRCRILRFSAEGGYRNRMTWLIEPSEDAKDEATQGLKTQAILATTGTFAEFSGFLRSNGRSRLRFFGSVLGGWL
jgi:hypothetical protein